MTLTAGNLEPLSIYRVLRIIAERRLSGRLTLTHDRLIKKARIANGVIVHVSSNVKSEGVIYHLVRGKILNAQQGEAISRHRVTSGGSSLDAIAAILGRRDEFVSHVAAVHRLRLLDVFRWAEGKFQFSSEEGTRLEGDIRLKISDVLLHAGAFVAPVDHCELFLHRYRHQAVKSQPSDEHLIDLFNHLFKSPNVLQALSRGPVDYIKLLATLGGGERALRQVFTLIISGLGTFTSAQSVPASPAAPDLSPSGPAETPKPSTPRPPSAPEASSSAQTVSARQASSEAPKLSTPRPVERPDLSQKSAQKTPEQRAAELRTTRPVGSTPRTPTRSAGSGARAPFRAPSRQPARPQPKSEAAVRKAKQADEAARLALKKAESLFAQLDELDHYALMGLEEKATDKALRDRFRSLAREFHLDRFVRLGIDQELRNQVKKVFMEINRAYHVLIDPEQRRDYDLSLQMGQTSASDLVHNALQAERLIKEGARLLKSGDLGVAKQRLQEALLNAPDDPVATGGLAYIEAVQSPHSDGFIRLQQIVAGRPPREEPYIYLGRLYRNRGDLKLAAQSFEQALSVNANCAEAQSELQFVRRKLKSAR